MSLARRTRRGRIGLAIVLAAVALSPAVATIGLADEKAVKAEKNPPGDIPDNQVFIVYTAPAGFSMKVPEGWSRKDTAEGARFFDKYNIIEMTSATTTAAPTAATAKVHEVADLIKTGRAVKVTAIKDVKLDGGAAVRIVYSSNSEPNSVTGKQIRLERERFLFFKDGKVVTVDLAVPYGADNVDQWQLMSNSFRWN